MVTLIQRIRRYRLLRTLLVLGALLAFVCFTNMLCTFFPESSFDLARESRLPKWVALPQGLTRDDVSLTMSYYSKLWGPDALFQLQDKNGRINKKESGRMRCREAFVLKDRPYDHSFKYPAYEAITVNGITEIIEHKKMEPIFYITDDPAVWERYRTNGC
jgi:hypothetical protein